MSDPFIAEIRIFAGNFAPRGWAFCEGQLLPISQNTALFSLVGTTYGGDGQSTLALPDLRGRAPMHPGSGPGLTSRRLGEKLGAGSLALTSNHLPVHNHAMYFEGNDIGGSNSPVNNVFAASSIPVASVFSNNPGNTPAGTLMDKGGGVAHNNEQPLIGVNFIIALVGLYPSRS